MSDLKQENHTESSHGIGHVVSMKYLVGVFLALVVLTGVTVGVAKIDLGNLNLYVALSVATVKATLVVLIFMHLAWDRGFNTIVFLGCLLFVTIFISLALTDTAANKNSVKEGQAELVKHVPFKEVQLK